MTCVAVDLNGQKAPEKMNVLSGGDYLTTNEKLYFNKRTETEAMHLFNGLCN